MDSSPLSGLMDGVRTMSLLLHSLAEKPRMEWHFKT